MLVENLLVSLENVARLPTVDEFIGSLLACRRTKDSAGARRLCIYFLLNDDLRVADGLGDYVVPMLVDCGSFHIAQLVFHGLHHPNVSSWTALVHGFNDRGEYRQAHNIFQRMQTACIQPNSYSYQAFVKTSVWLKDINFGRSLHVEIVKWGHDHNQIVVVTLIEMYVKCGLHAEAWVVLEKLPVQDVVPWNILINDYANSGLANKALHSFKHLEDIHLSPDVVTLVGCLKACSFVEDLNTGRLLHSCVQKYGYDRNVIVSNTLVDMYMNCGSIKDAEKVFDAISVRTVVSWNALLVGYLENGFEEDMLSCLDKMHLQCLSCTHVTVACGLCGCSRLGDVKGGRTLHTISIKMGLDSHPSVVSSLIEMYMSTGLLDEGQQVFNTQSANNVVSWTALISGYVEHGQMKIALNGYAKLRSAGVAPDASLYICLLECSCTTRSHTIYQIHCEVVKHGLELEMCVSHALLDTYSTIGLLLEMESVLNDMPASQALCCNVSIPFYIEHDLGTQNLLLQVENMLLIGTAFSNPMLVGSLRVCSRVSATDVGCNIHMKIVCLGLEKDPSLGIALISMYAKFMWFAEAHYVHNVNVARKSVFWWNTLLLGFADASQADQVLVCLSNMQIEGTDANEVTFVCGLKACGKLRNAKKGFELHASIASEGSERDALVGNSLVAMYAKLGLLPEALDAFNELPVKDVVPWNSIMAGHADHGHDEEVLNCWTKMESEIIASNCISLVLTLKACCNICTLEKGLFFHREAVAKGFEGNIFIAKALLDLYAKSGLLAEAMKTFNMVSAHNHMLWNALAGGFAYCGRTDLLIYALKRMKDDDIEPDGLTYVNVLSACSHTGLLEEGLACFHFLYANACVLPFHELYNCIIDLLGRAGQLTSAISLLELLPFQPDIVTWRVMLSACRKWRNLELGRISFESVIGLSSTESASCMVMLNMYAELEDDDYSINSETMCTESELTMTCP